MNKNLKIFIVALIILVLVFLLVFISGKYVLPDLLGGGVKIKTSNIPIEGERLLNKQAPFFDLADNLGSRVKLSQFINTPVVLVFWATWNKESADQVKIIDDFIHNGKNQASLVKFIAINSQEDPSLVKSFIRRGGYNVSFALDTSGEMSERYNIKSLPTAYFINKDGVISDIYVGVLSERMFVDKIEQLLR